MDYIAPLLFIAVIVAAVIIPARRAYLAAGSPRPLGDFVCTVCHTRMTPTERMPGSAALELLLWLLIILPGLFYSVWRRTNHYKVCSVCTSANPVPVTSSAGQKIIAG